MIIARHRAVPADSIILEEHGPGAAREVWFLNQLQQDFELEHFRGFSFVTSLDRADRNFTAMVRDFVYDDLTDFVLARGAGPGCRLFVGAGTREEARGRAVEFVNFRLAYRHAGKKRGKKK